MLSHEDQRPPAVAIMGPTAAGKTALAVRWAQRFGGEIVSVDSALVYRRLDIGSAKPDAETLARAPHWLIDIREPWQAYSAAEFADDALDAMQRIHAAGRLPLLVGGTGLYFRALFEGLAKMPAADAAVRAQLAGEAVRHGWASLHAQLASVDPRAAARIRPSDPQRIQRALEVFRSSGRTLSDWLAQGERRRFPFRVLRLVLAPADRAELHRRIAQRFDAMLEQGFLDEVRALRDDPRLHVGLPAIRAVGYRQAWEHLERAGEPEALRLRAIAATRQLAKRQLTWLRADPTARWFDPMLNEAHAERALDLFLARPVSAAGSAAV